MRAKEESGAQALERSSDRYGVTRRLRCALNQTGIIVGEFERALSQLHYQYKTPFGAITIREIDGTIANVVLSAVSFDDDFAPNSLINACANEIIEYLFGKRTMFDIPLRKQDSAFKEAVYAAVSDIPYGQTRSSKEIASMIGNADSYRAIGKALNENPLCILIPTHRVVRASSNMKQENDMASALRSLEAKFKTGV